MTYITYITKLYSQLLVAIVVGLAMLILLPERIIRIFLICWIYAHVCAA